jgi:hypothetical protein
MAKLGYDASKLKLFIYEKNSDSGACGCDMQFLRSAVGLSG